MKRMWSKNELRKIIQETYGIDINNLIDKDGHNRFIEGDITIETIEGATQTYGKWSLSGTHLLIVLSVSFANETIISNGTILATLSTLPKWIVDKIFTVYDTYVINKSTTFYASDGVSQSFSFNLRKQSNEIKIILSGGTATLTADRNGRISFDLLIDND